LWTVFRRELTLVDAADNVGIVALLITRDGRHGAVKGEIEPSTSRSRGEGAKSAK